MNLLSNKSRKGRTLFLQLIINEWPFVSKTKKRLLIEVFKTATFTQVDIQSDFLVPYHHISIKHNRFYRVQKTIIHTWRSMRSCSSSKMAKKEDFFKLGFCIPKEFSELWNFIFFNFHISSPWFDPGDFKNYIEKIPDTIGRGRTPKMEFINQNQ